MPRSATWICPTCRKRRSLRFCPQCGEERRRANDLSARDLATQFAKATSSIDGKFMRSWRILLTRPGRLTAAHITGERRRYITPLTLFFIGNAAFVAVQALTDVSILSSPLSSHLHSQDWSPWVRQLVQQRLIQRELTLEAYSPVFDRAALFNAKALIILMALSFAILPGIIFRARHRPAGVHIVFALHLYAFVLILLSGSVLLAAFDTMLGGGGLGSANVDKALSIFNLAACGAYLFVAIPRVYPIDGFWRWTASLVLTVAVALLFVGYRFVIFAISFATT